MTDDLIVLWRSEVEALRENAYRNHQDQTVALIDELLASAPAVMDAGVWCAFPDDEYPDDRSLASSDKSLTMLPGTYRFLLIEGKDE